MWLGAATGMVIALLLASPAGAVSGQLDQLAGDDGCISETVNETCFDGRGLDRVMDVVVSPDGENVYTVGWGHTIAVLDRDPSTGALTQRTGTDGCLSEAAMTDCENVHGIYNPQAIDISPDGEHVYTVGAFGQNSMLSVWDRQEDGSLDLVACMNEAGEDTNDDVDPRGSCDTARGIEGPLDVAVAPDGENVYVASSGSVVAMFERASEEGTLTQPGTSAGCVSDDGAPSCLDVRALSDAEALAFSPDGDQLYVAAAGSDAITRLERDDGGVLTQDPDAGSCISETGADGCTDGTTVSNLTSIAMAPDGRTLYASTENGYMARVVRDPATGDLSQPADEQQCLTLDGEDWLGQEGMCTNVHGIDGAYLHAILATDDHVYVAGNGSDTVAAFSRDADGALTHLPDPHDCWSESGTDYADDAAGTTCRDGRAMDGANPITMSPDGSDVYVGAYHDDAVDVFDREGDPPQNTAPPQISGTARDGETLTATDGEWSGTGPMAFERRWQRCEGDACTDIGGQTGTTYTLTTADVGFRIRVVVSAESSWGSDTEESAQTDEVAPFDDGGDPDEEGDPPANVILPSIAGTPRDGETVFGSSGTFSGDHPISLEYRWLRCAPACTEVGSGTSYAVGPDDVGAVLRLRVTATNAHGAAAAESAPFGPVAPLPPSNLAPPRIGGSGYVGDALVVEGNGEWRGTPPLELGLQWMRCAVYFGVSPPRRTCSDIPGATGPQYVVQPGDAVAARFYYGELSVRVTISNAAGAATAVSNTVIAAAQPTGGPIAAFKPDPDPDLPVPPFEQSADPAPDQRPICIHEIEVEAGGVGKQVLKAACFVKEAGSAAADRVVEVAREGAGGVVRRVVKPAGDYFSGGVVRMAGMIVEPVGAGARVLVTRAGRMLSTTGNGVLRVGNRIIKTAGAIRELLVGREFRFDTGTAKIFGLGLRDGVISFEPGGTRIGLTVETPPPFRVTPRLDLYVDAENGLALERTSLKIEGHELFPVPLWLRKRVEFGFARWKAGPFGVFGDPPQQTFDGPAYEGFFAKVDSTDLVPLIPRLLQLPALNGRLAIVNGRLGYARLAGDNLNVPVAGGMTLKRVDTQASANPLTMVGEVELATPTIFWEQPFVSFTGRARFQADPTQLELGGSASWAGISNADVRAKLGPGDRMTFDATAGLYTQIAGIDLDRYGFGYKGVLSGWASGGGFQVDGTGTINGKQYRADAVFSDRGAAICRRSENGPDFGGGLEWRRTAGETLSSLRIMASACDLGPWRSRAAQGGAALTSELPAGLHTAAFEVAGEGGLPRVRLVGPAGQSVDTGESLDDRPPFAVVPDAENGRVFIAVGKPAAGPWRVEPLAGSVPIASLRSAQSLPAPRVRARVRGGRLRYTIAPLEGQAVRFVERIGAEERPIGVARGARGSLRFRPGHGPAGRRRILAEVSQYGLPRTTVVAGSFRSRATGRPGAPRGLRARVRGGRLTASWRRVPGAARYLVTVGSRDGRVVQRTARRPRLALRRPGPGRLFVAVRAVSADGAYGRTARRGVRG